MTRKEIDEHTGTETTGHEWDGIKELNTPLPRWWLWLFYITIIWSIGYWVVMPAWPLVSDYTRGILNHSQRRDVAEAVEALKVARADFSAKLSGATLQQIEGDPSLLQFAMAAGKSSFGDNCATCHGAGGQGGPGYPNLNDDVWLWGGTLDDIRTTITIGIRSTHEETRQSIMPAFGKDALLTKEQIADAAEYVLALSGQQADAAAVSRAAPLFEEQCSICHGPQGKGMREFGAPDLTDADWLYGSSREAITAQIVNPKMGQMPTWQGRLDKATIDALAVYVHSLGGGE